MDVHGACNVFSGSLIRFFWPSPMPKGFSAGTIGVSLARRWRHCQVSKEAKGSRKRRSWDRSGRDGSFHMHRSLGGVQTMFGLLLYIVIYFFNGFLNGSLGCGPEHFWVFGFGPLWAHASLYLETFCHPLEIFGAGIQCLSWCKGITLKLHPAQVYLMYIPK